MRCAGRFAKLGCLYTKVGGPWSPALELKICARRSADDPRQSFRQERPTMTAVLPQTTEQPLVATLWSHRPQLLHLGLFVAAYVLGCGFAQLLAIVPGTGISIWPPSGLFIATLILAPRQSWLWWLLA